MISGPRARKLAVFSVSVLVLAGATAVSTSDLAMSAAARALADPLAVLAERSPGARGAAELTQIKPQRVAALERPPGAGGAPFVPSERVLPLERVRPGIPVIDGLAPPAGFAGPPLLVPPGGGGVLDNGAPGLVPPVDGGGGGFLPNPTLPVGGGGGGGVVIPGTDVPPTGAVPEPASWATLIGGTLAIGSALRRRRRRGVPPAGRAEAAR